MKKSISTKTDIELTNPSPTFLRGKILLLFFSVSAALVISVTFSLINPRNQKYLSQHIYQYPRGDQQYQEYFDISNDGLKEWVNFSTLEGHTTVYLNDYDHKRTKKYYLYGTPAEMFIMDFKPTYKNLNNSKEKEIILFTQSNDSIFLHALDITLDTPLIEQHLIFIVPPESIHEHISIQTIWDRENVNEADPYLFFLISTNRGVFKPLLCKLNMHNLELKTSHALNRKAYISTIPDNQDSLIYIFETFLYPEDSVQNPQKSSTLSVYNKNLDKLRTHVFTKNESLLFLSFFKTDKNVYFQGASLNRNDEKNTKLWILRKDGTANHLLSADGIDQSFLPFTFTNNRNTYIGIIVRSSLGLDSMLYIEPKNPELLIPYTKKNSFTENSSLMDMKDIDDDGTLEFIKRDFGKMTIFRRNLKHPVVLELENTKGNYPMLYSAKTEKGITNILILTSKSLHSFKYYKNPDFMKPDLDMLFRFLISFLIVFSALFASRHLNQKFAQQRELIVQQQLQNVRNQLDPHFTFNALNTVGNAIYQENKELTFDLFHRFTRLIRTSLMASNKIFVTLSEELKFTRDYLEFQKIRFKDTFDYSIQIEEFVPADQIQIPKLIIQNFAENAVKHAFPEIDYTGQLTISIYEENAHTVIVIEDNGIGINKSKADRKTSGTQKGEETIREHLQLIRKLYNVHIRLDITDKSETHASNGTLVKLII